MQILLIAATEPEIGPFTAANTDIDVLITGVGVPATMYQLQKRIQQTGYDLIIQAGVAGAFRADIPLGETVLVKEDSFADLGMEEKENFISIFDTALAGKNDPPFKNGWLQNPHTVINSSVLPAVKAITVNKISDSLLQKEQLVKQFGADIESMEGAALHYVCLQENIPFLQIRSVSNYVGERDKAQWNMKEAIENLNTALGRMITELNI